MADGIHAAHVAGEFPEHTKQEDGHADRITERIIQLSGKPNYFPDGLSTRCHEDFIEN